MEPSSNITVIATTNRVELIDEALLRPGRFDKIIEIPLPDLEARTAIYRVHMKNRPISMDIDYGEISGLSEGLSGAEIAAVCNEASMILLKQNLAQSMQGESNITMSELQQALETIKNRKKAIKPPEPKKKRPSTI